MVQIDSNILNELEHYITPPGFDIDELFLKTEVLSIYDIRKPKSELANYICRKYKNVDFIFSIVSVYGYIGFSYNEIKLLMQYKIFNLNIKELTNIGKCGYNISAFDKYLENN